jgi:glycosyltransferase involved in cell wall biosynthesis
MNQFPTVAILVAVYNVEKHLEALLSSLLAQDYPSIQIHLRDNCSKDRTREILKQWQQRYPEKIHLHFSPTNVGVIGNFAELTEIGNAPYLMYCDGDDVWFPSKVSKTLAKMQQLEKEYGISMPLLVHTDLQVVDEKLNVIAPSFWKYSKLNTHEKCHQLPRLLVQNHVTGCTTMINRALKELAAPIPLNCVMHDWWLALVAACFGKIGCIPEATMAYRQHSSNDTGAKAYGLLRYFKRKRSKPNHAIQKSTQVQQFIERYQFSLSKHDQTLLHAYLRLQKASLVKKIALIIRHGFFKSGFLRNFILNH